MDPMQTVGALRAEISIRLEWIAFDIFARDKAAAEGAEFRLFDQDSLYLGWMRVSLTCAPTVLLSVTNATLDDVVIVVRQHQEVKPAVLSHADGELPDAAEWVYYDDDHSFEARLTQAIVSEVRNFVTRICAIH